MKKFFLTLFFILALMMEAHGATIGYCNGEYSKRGNFSVDGNVNVSGAIYLPPSFLQSYDDCDITALRVALASKINIDKITLWLRTSLDGENLAETVVTNDTEPAIAKGWIETALPSHFTINASEGLYIGVTYHQKASTKAFSLIGVGFENSFIVRLSDDSEWQQMPSEGILSIEAVVEGETGPDYDLAVISAVADISSDPENNIVTASVANNGLLPVSGFSIACSYKSLPDDKTIFHFECDLQPGGKYDAVCPVAKSGNIYTDPLVVSIEGIDNGQDMISDNNKLDVRVPALKKVLLEEYTTELCSNCPRVARYLHEILEEEEYAAKTVAVCHHAGYMTDWLTQPCDEEMVDFFDFGFAPAVSYDRMPYFGGKIVHTPDKQDMKIMIDKRAAIPAETNIAITPRYSSESGTVDVEVNVERLQTNIQNPYLTVYLVENNVQPRRQSGDDEGTHIHQHVIRTYNSTWGEPIAWTGSTYTSSLRFDVDAEWKVNDLAVVALVSNRNPDDAADNAVDNVEQVSVIGSSIETVDTDSSVVSTEYYTPDGIRVNDDTEGMIIKVCRMSDGSMQIRKIIK